VNAFATTVISARPLDNFAVIRSRNVEEVRDAIARVYAKPALVPELVARRSVRQIDAIFNNCRLQNIELAYASFGGPLGFMFPASGFFSQLFPIHGKADAILDGRPRTASAGTGIVIGPDAPHRINYSADYEHLVLRINARVLTDKLAAMTGAVIDEPLHIDPQQEVRGPAAQMLGEYIPLLAEALSAATSAFSDLWIAQTEQLVMTLFLCGHRHNYSRLLEQEAADAAPREVRRAEEYIAAHAERAITLEELAEVTGISMLRLYGAFKKYRGYSPLAFQAQVRSRRRSGQ
jgi:hypothetical protein